MSDAFRLGIVVAPLSQHTAVRLLIGTRCMKMGWRFDKSYTVEDDGRNSVLLVKEITHARVAEADLWVIIGGTAEEIMALALEKPELTPREAARYASARLAALSELMAGGALFFPSGQVKLDIPQFGVVTIPAMDDQPETAPMPSELAIYRQIPVAANASAEWPRDVFDYTLKSELLGGGPEIELTGRGRILVHGPYIDLPAGHWRVTARFTVFPEDIAYLVFEWGVLGAQTVHSVEVNKEGAYELVMDHVLVERGPMELRVWAARGHFMGRMAMGDCTVERLPTTAA
jgi:hypothetical protein